MMIAALDSAIIGTAVWLFKWMFTCSVTAWIIALLYRPLRDRYDAEFLLDLLEDAEQEGRSVEHDMLEIAKVRDRSVGSQFFFLTTWIKSGMTLAEALRKARNALPRSIQQMLIYGLENNLLKEVIPVCRRRLADAESKWRTASTVVAGSGAGVAFLAVPIVSVIAIFVFPKFEAIAADMVGDNYGIAPLFFSFDRELFRNLLYTITILVFINFWIFTAIIPTRGFMPPIEWLLERFSFPHAWLPWNRLRARADLTALIAAFLDAGLPEEKALAWAGEAVGDRRERKLAKRAGDELKSGVPLYEALRKIETGGGFLWRIRNLRARRSGFTDALANWHRSLEAKAMFKEQAAVQLYTTFLIIVTGSIIGLFVAGIFQMLTGLILAVGAPW